MKELLKFTTMSNFTFNRTNRQIVMEMRIVILSERINDVIWQNVTEKVLMSVMMTHFRGRPYMDFTESGANFGI